MIQLKVIRSQGIEAHQEKFKDFCKIFHSSRYELLEVEPKVLRDPDDGFMTYVTFIIYKENGLNP